MSSGALGVGVALCTYDGERFAAEQVRSILGQSAPPEVIVLGDDGSRDRTIEIVRETVGEAVGGTVRLIVLPEGERLGVTRNFERTVAAVDAPLVALSDQDDVWQPDRLRRVAALFDDDSVLLVHTDARLIGPDGTPLGRSLFEDLEVSAQELALERSGRAFDVFLRRNLATGATVVFRRTLLEAALPFPGEWVHDEWLAVLAAALGGVAVVTDQTVDYRLHGANQIGVSAPTLRYKVGRVLERRGERNRVLARRFAVLAERLDALPVAESVRQAAHAKAEFEARRAAMPDGRLRRAFPVLRLAATKAYGRFASRGVADIGRDLLQPA